MEQGLNVKEILSLIHKYAPKRRVKIMNVCGSHEHTVASSGMRSVLPDTVELVPGPGCPVCVCSESDLINAIELSKRDDVILVTYGDMLRVPTRVGSIREKGKNFKVISAPHEVLKVAKDNPDKKVVFFSVGFETTSAPTAGLLEMGVPKNLYILCSQKLTPAIMEVLVKDEEVGVDAFVAPGHVSTIVGANAWRIFPEKYNIPTVVAGFTPENFLLAILRILVQLKKGESKLENVYRGVVRDEGNKRAQHLINKFFKVASVNWRGIGFVPNSGLELRDEYDHIDARKVFDLPEVEEEKIPGCICDKVVLGKAYPSDCPLFGKSCTPLNPKGPCMVSVEGACNIWLRQKPEKEKLW
jgi:hydrogenase expression/formation protein HypD